MPVKMHYVSRSDIFKGVKDNQDDKNSPGIHKHQVFGTICRDYRERQVLGRRKGGKIGASSYGWALVNKNLAVIFLSGFRIIVAVCCVSKFF